MSGSSAVVEVSALEGLDLHQLREVWKTRYGAPPRLRSVELLGLMLAWRMQTETSGRLHVDTRRALRRPASERPRLIAASGVRLVREWQGVRYEVITTDDGGFLYAGERYASLSQIARRITGSRWNGPRFFGLRSEKAAA